MGTPSHRKAAPVSVACFVVTVSDTRTETSDTSGRAIAELLESAGHTVVGRAIVHDEPVLVRALVEQQLADPAVQVVITTGGTGLSSRDTTYEALAGVMEKRLDGFGEIFRALSFQEIGPAAMLSRACAGVALGKIVVALPGSEHAVRLAVGKLLLPELGHLVQQVSK